MADIVKDKTTGLLFTPMNTQELAEKVKWLWNNPEECERMGQNARKEYEEKYTPEKNYEMLMGIYEKVIRMRR
jgi:glycosyltransferase involved in cell wall biosynthesis